MNGRCQKDALDRAEDICELCGHQFCASCLLFPRGHRSPPTCKTCALEHSGLRGGSTKRQAISKREYKKRKKELLAELESVEDQQPAIEYFELNDPSKFDRSNELDRRTVVVEDEPTIDILATSDDPPAPAPPAPNPAPIPPAPQAAPPPPEPVAAEFDDHAIAGLAPVDTSVNPLALGGSGAPTPTPPPSTPTSESSSSAAELLARLKADQPIQSQFTAAPVGLDTDPFATPTSDLVAPPQREAAAASTAPPASLTSSQTATTAVPKTEPWSPPSPPPRGSNLNAMSAQAPPTPAPTQQAPSSGSPFESAPSDPALSDPALSDPALSDPAPSDPALSDPAPFESGAFDAFAPAEPAPSDEHPMRRKADTDESGQWIPPSLRGMATPDERDPLPKRRS